MKKINDRQGWQWVMRLSMFAMTVLIANPAFSAGWDARTRLINTVIQNQDVKLALDRSISSQFQSTFPAAQYGIYVVVDKSNANTPTRGVVYIMLGLSKRNTDGSYKLPEFTYSSMLVLGAVDPNQERQQIINRLIEQAPVFVNLAIQNAAKLR